MNRKLIFILMMALVGVIVALVTMDRLSSRPDKRPDNPYEYNIDEFRNVDPDLILYQEIKNIKLGEEKLRGISWSDNKLFLVADDYLLVITPEGRQLLKSELTESPRCIHVAEPGIFIGFQKHAGLFDHTGKLLQEFRVPGDSSHFTSLAYKSSSLYIADAGKRIVYIFNPDGEVTGEIHGKREMEDLHGFIIPSPCFDLAISPDGELWVVNPGMHALENYSDQGKLRGFWERSAMTLDGFSGCCNPAHMAILPDGTFVTAEKGLVRIKIYKPSGEFIGVVAAPEKFLNGETAPDLAVSSSGVIYALDFDKKMIRVFE